MTREQWWAVRVVNEKHQERNGWLDATALWWPCPCGIGTRKEARRIARIKGFQGDVRIVKRIIVEYD
jgi:hypothetical protein